MHSYEDVGPLLAIVALIVIGLVPSRGEPTCAFFANQRWRYRDLTLVVAIVTVSHWVPLPLSGSETEARLLAISHGSMALVTTLSVWGVVRWNQQRPWQALGLESTKALYEILWSLRTALGCVSGLVAVVLLSGVRVFEHPISDLASAAEAGIGDWVATFVVTAVFSPLSEELLSRGLTYGPLMKWTANEEIRHRRRDDRNCSTVGIETRKGSGAPSIRLRARCHLCRNLSPPTVTCSNSDISHRAEHFCDYISRWLSWHVGLFTSGLANALGRQCSAVLPG
jgi:hypothetical protein